MESRFLGAGTNVIKPRLECTTLESIPEMSDPGLTWSPSSSPRSHGSPMAIRSRSLPGPVGNLSVPPTTPPPQTGTCPASPKSGMTDREIRILVIGCQGVGKSGWFQLIVHFAIITPVKKSKDIKTYFSRTIIFSWHIRKK